MGSNTITSEVRRTCELIANNSKHVIINDSKIQESVQQLSQTQLQRMCSPQAFDHELHFYDGGPLTAQYLLVVDCINFCFWPEEGLEYEHLARGFKEAVQKDSSIISAENLAKIKGVQLRSILGWKSELPLEEERTRLIREVGSVLVEHFDGEAQNLIVSAGKSCAKLTELVAKYFPGFRDHGIYKGKQVFLYKRAQIFVGDVWGCFGGCGLGEFTDIEELTMFADYRVPVVLREMGILEYSQQLKTLVDGKSQVCAGSEEEIEIRGCTVESVERLKREIGRNFPKDLSPHSIQIDWWLWEIGEKNIKKHSPHHRVLTVYY